MFTYLRFGPGRGAEIWQYVLSSQEEIICKSIRHSEQQDSQWCSMCHLTVITCHLSQGTGAMGCCFAADRCSLVLHNLLLICKSTYIAFTHVALGFTAAVLTSLCHVTSTVRLSAAAADPRTRSCGCWRRLFLLQDSLLGMCEAM
jgi:hypothetical protein